MSRHIIFLVHGMGVHGEDWSSDVQNQIRSLYDRYPGLSCTPFEDRFEFSAIRYDHIFDELRTQWGNEPQEVVNRFAQTNIGNSTIEFLTGLARKPAEDTFFGSHILDILLYRFFPLVADRIRVDVASQIIETLAGTDETHVLRWSVIAHSLGTSVIHDTLDALYNTGFPDIPDSPLSPTDTRARVIMMVANVSRLLQTNVKAYNSLVRPGKDKSAGICDYFINAKHQWDVIVRPKEFDPDDQWPDLPTRMAHRFIPVVVTDFREKDIHSLRYYLENPKVHISLFRSLTARFMIHDDEEKAAIAAYERETLEGKYKDLRQNLKKIAPGENTDWKEVVSSIQEFLMMIR